MAAERGDAMAARLEDLVKVVSQKTERRTNYLQWVEQEYQFLPLIGMGVDDVVPIQLPLLDLYVPLKASRERPAGGATVANPRLAGRPLPPEETAASSAVNVHSQRRAAILGACCRR
jgi:hypothetical protein